MSLWLHGTNKYETILNIILDSSTVEQPAVNRQVRGSNPRRGATLLFLLALLGEMNIISYTRIVAI